MLMACPEQFLAHSRISLGVLNQTNKDRSGKIVLRTLPKIRHGSSRCVNSPKTRTFLDGKDFEKPIRVRTRQPRKCTSRRHVSARTSIGGWCIWRMKLWQSYSRVAVPVWGATSRFGRSCFQPAISQQRRYSTAAVEKREARPNSHGSPSGTVPPEVA